MTGGQRSACPRGHGRRGFPERGGAWLGRGRKDRKGRVGLCSRRGRRHSRGPGQMARVTPALQKDLRSGKRAGWGRARVHLNSPPNLTQLSVNIQGNGGPHLGSRNPGSRGGGHVRPVGRWAALRGLIPRGPQLHLLDRSLTCHGWCRGAGGWGTRGCCCGGAAVSAASLR